ncbi:MAG: GNAT family N-acetyltransferase [Deltaproteobacteria bacterium]|nr:GNAT family N-acetyltransferase [Deltaproteobacteria bacterium]
MKPPEVFETERLRLRRPVIEDAESIFSGYAQDGEVTKYLTWRPHESIDSTHEFLRLCITAWDEGKSVQWVIVRKEDNLLLGMVGIRLDRYKVELGYLLAKPYWGNGYMTEAVQAIVEWALNQEGIYRVWAVCDVENLASARVLEKIGMRREGVLRRWSMHPNRSGEPRDCYCYAKTK